ncbi:MAG: NAD-dependent protein deacetylase [Burkholderiales bacterium]|nr:NAD-dependent protein deacetylase [Burkholderiales bacterium]
MHPVDELLDFLAQMPRVAVLTGAGVSTASGIPGYRDREAQWTRRQPVTHQEFVADPAVRRRYWARSMRGWPTMRDARPNAAHLALARLAAAGRVTSLITQNVDGLHERAGHAQVIPLHGRLAEVVCLGCGARSAREALQRALEDANPQFAAAAAGVAPDGDADLEADFDAYHVPSCTLCGGILKPDVVFYGDAVPAGRAQAALEAVDDVDALLVVGSSLMVRSAYRLCERAQGRGTPIVAVNHGRTRADAMFARKLDADCVAVLAAWAAG